MCGICGKLELDPGRPVDEGTIRRMTRVLAHRGPDDEGVYVEGSLGLGHRRLSILDLSAAGHQPMSSEDGSRWIVFNGEIYNYLELRADLERRGHRFRSRTDTEVVLKLYELHGPGCVLQLRGMFAFAIWDSPRRRLFLARDRLGKKPLHYSPGPKAFVFASEIKAILQDPDFQRDVDPVAIHHYLTYQCVPAPHSALKRIHKLPPAHYLILENGRIETERYWKLSYLPKIAVRNERQLRDLEMELVQRLEDAVRLRLISDVPLGAFLSGGVDSSAVVALMSRMGTQPVKTFSIGFNEDAYDELSYARIVAERFGTDHTEFRVKPDALEVLPKLVWHYDEPYADASAIPTYYVSKLAREHVTVVLTGDAGDESFAGYDRYVANDFAQRLQWLAPLLSARAMRRVIETVPHGRSPKNSIWRIKRFLKQLGKPPEHRNLGWLTQFGSAEKKLLCTDEFNAALNGNQSEDLHLSWYREAEAEDFLDRILYADVMTYLPDDLLVKTDIASMANSLEARAPFLDHVFMEFAARIPADLKLRRGQSKYVLKRAFRSILPEQILRRGKMGFSVPIDSWLRHELKEMSNDLLLSPQSLQRGYFRREFLVKMLEEHAAGKWNWHCEIWNLMMLELWHRTFIDG